MPDHLPSSEISTGVYATLPLPKRQNLVNQLDYVAHGRFPIRLPWYRRPFSDQEFVREIERLLKVETNPELQKTLVVICTRLRSPEAEDALIYALSLTGASIQERAATGLSEIKSRKATTALAELLEGESWHVAAQAITRIGDPRGEEILKAAADRAEGTKRNILMSRAKVLRSRKTKPGSTDAPVR